MDFPRRLDALIVTNTTDIVDGSSLDEWNDKVETYLAAPPGSETNASSALDDCCADGSDGDGDGSDDDGSWQLAMVRVAKNLQQLIIRAVVSHTEATADKARAHLQQTGRCSDEPCLLRCVRTCKNLFRWYLQIYVEEKQQKRHLHRSTTANDDDDDDDDDDDEDPLRLLKNPDMLDLMLEVLEWSAMNRTSHLSYPKGSRNASLYLFYATFGLSPDDEGAQGGMEHLLNHNDFATKALRLLTRMDSVALALSLVRNLHNMAVSFPGASKRIVEVEIDCNAPTADATNWAPWITMSDDDKEATTINFVSVFVNLIDWSLSSEPAFPGMDPEDKRAELVSEILNASYALRIGQSLSSSCDASNRGLAEVICRLLSLQQTIDNNDIDSKELSQVKQCRLAAVLLLMESNATFGEFLLRETSSAALDSLLQLLSKQVKDVVDQTRVDDSAISALVPILVALNKYSASSTNFRKFVKAFLFLPDSEKEFQKHVAEYDASNKVSGRTKENMSPLMDVSKDTLQGRLVMLLSWPESTIKRCTAEFVWTLCSSNAKEYVRRVGLGNALPLLNAKGLAPMAIPS